MAPAAGNRPSATSQALEQRGRTGPGQRMDKHAAGASEARVKRSAGRTGLETARVSGEQAVAGRLRPRSAMRVSLRDASDSESDLGPDSESSDDDNMEDLEASESDADDDEFLEAEAPDVLVAWRSSEVEASDAEDPVPGAKRRRTTPAVILGAGKLSSKRRKLAPKSPITATLHLATTAAACGSGAGAPRPGKGRRKRLMVVADVNGNGEVPLSGLAQEGGASFLPNPETGPEGDTKLGPAAKRRRTQPAAASGRGGSDAEGNGDISSALAVLRLALGRPTTRVQDGGTNGIDEDGGSDEVAIINPDAELEEPNARAASSPAAEDGVGTDVATAAKGSKWLYSKTYTGVCSQNNGQKWRAKRGKVHIGTFPTEFAAAKARTKWDVKLDGADFQKLLVPLTEEEVEAVNALTREELLAELRSENALMPQPRKRRKPATRPNRRWTLAEEAALRRGVAKHGVGRWQQVITDPDEAIGPLLRARSNGDLRSKWRNMHKKTPKASPQKPQSRSSMEASADAPSEVLAELQRATEHACPPKAGSVGGGTRAGATLAQDQNISEVVSKLEGEDEALPTCTHATCSTIVTSKTAADDEANGIAGSLDAMIGQWRQLVVQDNDEQAQMHGVGEQAVEFVTYHMEALQARGDWLLDQELLHPAELAAALGAVAHPDAAAYNGAGGDPPSSKEEPFCLLRSAVMSASLNEAAPSPHQAAAVAAAEPELQQAWRSHWFLPDDVIDDLQPEVAAVMDAVSAWGLHNDATQIVQGQLPPLLDSASGVLNTT